MQARPAEASDIAVLSRLWFDGWHDAHGKIVPAALVEARTLDHLAARMRTALGNVWAIGPREAPLGFYILKHDELDQFYVCKQARGSGIAALLIADAETRLLQSGHSAAWLACAIGNWRAARFYEKNGWSQSGKATVELQAPDRPFPLQVWRYEMRLAP